MNLNEAKLQQRNKELDAREEFLDIKQKTIENGPLTIKVYDATVKAKENQLDNLAQQIKEREAQLVRLTSAYDNQKASTTRQTQSLRSEVEDKNSKLKEVKNKVRDIKTELQSLQNEIEERRTYLETQEQTIELTITNGNERLLDLKDEMEANEQELKKVKVTTADYMERMYEAEKAYYQLRSDIDDQTAELLTNIASLKVKKDQVSQDVIKATSKYKGITTEAEDKLKQLDIKEKSLLAKRDEILLLQDELAVDKRRWESKKSLYDVL